MKLLAASPDVIRKAEDRQLFKDAMIKIGLDVPRSGYARSMEDARRIRELIEQYQRAAANR